jgi:hypothetical protein
VVVFFESGFNIIMARKWNNGGRPYSVSAVNPTKLKDAQSERLHNDLRRCFLLWISSALLTIFT